MAIRETLFYVFLLLAIQAAIGIIMERRRPVSALAWVLVLILLPIVGLPLYVLIGRVRVHRKIRRHMLATMRHRAASSQEPSEAGGTSGELLEDSDAGISMLVSSVIGIPLRLHNRARLLQDGPETFDAMAAAIRMAREFVHLELFIFRPGAVGRRIRDLLVEAAARGVEVRLICDGFGSLWLSDEFLRPLLAEGARVTWFMPVRFPRLRRRPDFRNHRKILVVDGRVAFVGGINVMDEYVIRDEPGTPWRDVQLRLEGPVVHDLEQLFLEDWFYATDEVLSGRDYFPQPDEGGSIVAQVLAGGPDCRWPVLEYAFSAAVHAAHCRLRFTTPYFVPADASLSALISAALRGVDVEMMVPERGDHLLVDWASRSYFPELLEAGVRIYEYGPRMIHSKTLSVDGRFCLVGSANVDLRSFRLNYEVGACLFDTQLAADLDRSFERDLESCLPIRLDSFSARPLLHRVRENVARLLSPLL